MSPWRAIAPPLGGLSEGAASSQQPSGTTPMEVNMRSRDARTGQERLSSREGLRRVGEGAAAVSGAGVTSIHRVGSHRRLADWVKLTAAADAEVSPSVVEEAGTLKLNAAAVAVDTDSQGARYYLLADGSVAVVNQEDVLAETIRVPTLGGGRLVHQVVVDEEGGVLVGWAGLVEREEGASRLYRMRQSATSGWELHWEFGFTGELISFGGRYGEVVAGLHSLPDDEEAPQALMARVGQTFSSAPRVVFGRPAAYPIAQVDQRQDGAIFVASEPNPSRGDGSAGGTVPEWSPRNPVASTYDPTTELCWWTSAIRIQQAGAQPGDRLNRWVNELEDANPYSTPVASSGRAFYDVGVATGPIFVDDGPQPTRAGLRFQAGRHLASREVQDEREKASVNDGAWWHEVPLAGMRESGQPGHAAAMVLGFTPDLDAAEMFVFGGSNIWVTYRYDSGASTHRVRVYAIYLSAVPTGWTDDSTGQNRAYIEMTRVGGSAQRFVLGIMFNGRDVAGSQVRLNGTSEWTGAFSRFPTDDGQRYDLGRDTSGVFSKDYEGTYHECIGCMGRTVGTPHDTPVALDTVERFEAFVAYSYGFDSVLPGSHAYNAAAPTAGGQTNPEGGLGLDEPEGVLVKFTLDGTPTWKAAGSQFGSAFALGLEGDIYTAGYKEGTDLATTAAMLGRVIDEGTTVTTTGGDTWTVDGKETERYARFPRLVFDGCESVAWCRHTVGGDAPRAALELYDRDGTARWSFTPPDGATIVDVVGHGERVDERETGGVCGVEYLGAAALEDPQARRITVLGQRRTGATSTRWVRTFATASDGTLSRIDVEDGAEWEDVLATDLNGARPFSIHIYPLTLFGDGRGDYQVFDARTQRVRAYASTTKGGPPRRCTFGVSYRGRAVLGGGEYPSQIDYSASGVITDWDSNPAVVTAEQAVTQGVGRARQFPGLVRGLRAVGDDLLIVFCDDKVWRQTGDPMIGGQFDALVDGVGLADTWAHTNDPDGALYWMSTHGHVYVMLPNGQRYSLVERRIRQRLLDLDLKRYRVELHWDTVQDGLWVVKIPRGAPEAGVEHLFWCKVTNSWHPVVFGGDAGRCVTAVGHQDGDGPKDVALLFGFADGHVRATDRFAVDDDGVPYSWQALIGPLFPGSQQREVRLAGLELAVAHGSNECEVGAYASPVADVLGAPSGVRRVRSGRGLRVPVRCRGAALWVGMAGKGPWALEELAGQFSGAGAKQRTRRSRK